MSRKRIYKIKENLDIYENHYFTAHYCENNIFNKTIRESILTNGFVNGNIYSHPTIEAAEITIEKHKQELSNEERRRNAAFSKVIKVIPA